VFTIKITLSELWSIVAISAIILLFLLGIFLSFKAGIRHRIKTAEAKIGNAEFEAENIILEAEKKSQAKKREIMLLAKEEVHKARVEFEKEIKERRIETQRLERRLLSKEETIDRKLDNLETKREELENKDLELESIKEATLEMQKKQLTELERISGLSQSDAKDYLLQCIRQEMTHESAQLIREIEERTKDEADKKAKEIISYAISKCAADHVSETTVSVVPLPNDEMKGRIIGREGRNIRTLETLTGIDLIIDDTPEAVILSGFDPVRREIARIALEKLITDGRIHPARIEEMVEKAKKEVDATIRQEGEQATYELGVHGIHPEMIKLLGRLRYRTSYGQSVLNHSKEVAYLAGAMAAELGLDITLAKRAGLLHDIGKATDFEMEGSHISIGEDLARKYHENDTVINSIMSHHGDVEPTSIISILVQAADSISAARPGARKETLDSYIKRLKMLEDIANGFEGVENSYAIQAGREIRIIINPEKISDDELVLKTREIAKKIEMELQYPGQIKVIAMRETRAIDYAK
jgi:ribonucrease Y